MPNGGDMSIDTLSSTFMPDMCTNGVPALSVVLNSAIRQTEGFQFKGKMKYLYGII